jgi:hypothetical protein
MAEMVSSSLWLPLTRCALDVQVTATGHLDEVQELANTSSSSGSAGDLGRCDLHCCAPFARLP